MPVRNAPINEIPVAAVGLAIGLLLRLWVQIIVTIVLPEWRLPLIGLLCVSITRAYPKSVLGMADMLLYRSAKLVFMCLALGLATDEVRASNPYGDYPAAALAVFDFAVGSWSGLEPGAGALTEFIRAETLPPAP